MDRNKQGPQAGGPLRRSNRMPSRWFLMMISLWNLKSAGRELHRFKKVQAKSFRDKLRSFLTVRKSQQSKYRPNPKIPQRSQSCSRLANGTLTPSCWRKNMSSSALEQVEAASSLVVSGATTETCFEQSKTPTSICSELSSTISKTSQVWSTNGLLTPTTRRH